MVPSKNLLSCSHFNGYLLLQSVKPDVDLSVIVWYHSLMNLPEFLDRITTVTGYKPRHRTGDTYQGRCPVHDDKKSSLSITGDSSKVVVNCFAGCDWKDILGYVEQGICTSYTEEKVYETPPPWLRKIEKVYSYKDAKGKLLYQKVRFPGKDFSIRYKQGNWWWYGYPADVEPVLYNLPNVMKSTSVFVVEGEKDADRLISLGLCATCNYDGASVGKSDWRDSYTQCLRDKCVMLLSDNDEAGICHMTNVFNKLQDVVKEVSIIPLTGLTYKRDISDWLDLGYSIEELRSLYVRTKNKEIGVHYGSGYNGSS